MAIGLITNPATWLLGTPAAPSWFQNAQDNINGLLQQGVTTAGLWVDGTGGVAPGATRPGFITLLGSAPGYAAGTGAGTGATINGSFGCDSAHTINLNTGTSPATNATIYTVTFAQPFSDQGTPVFLLTAANQNAALLSGASMPFLQKNISGGKVVGYSMKSSNTALTASVLYNWSVLIIGNVVA